MGLYYFNDSRASDVWQALRSYHEEGRSVLKSIGEVADSRLRIVDLLAFTLMPNHFHIILKEIREGGIIDFMRKLGGYSWYFNKQYGRVGPLFQSRYKCVKVNSEAQLGNAFVYVHTNPVELKEPGWKDLKVANPKNALNWLETYRWSSYHDYVGRSMFPTVTQRDFFLNYYGDERGCRQAVEDWIMFKAENYKLDPGIIFE